ncbi:MAG: hypothetical protein IK097_05480 [Clostridia bacterium]|nr:hypothetical protein [Clostridia bacterium]
MTSRKSSLNPFGFTYREMIKRFLAVPVPLTAAALFIFGEIIPRFFSYRSALSRGDTAFAESIRGTARFVFISGSDASLFAYAYTIIMIVIGLVLALYSFGFMMLRPSANVQYSLGISRNKQFGARYLAVTTIIGLSVVIPMLIVAFFNVAFYGSSKELWTAFAFMCLSHFTVFLWAYTVYVFAMVQVGSIIESVVMGSVCVLAPGLLSSAFYSLISVFTYGSPLLNSSTFDTNINFFYTNGNMVAGPHEKLFGFSEYLFPISSAADSFYMSNGEDYPFPPFAKFLGFLAVTLLIACAAKYLHSRRKAEKAGFMGTSPVLEGFCVVTVGPFLACVIGQGINSSELSRGAVKVITVLAGVIIMAVGYTLVDLFLTRSAKAFRKRLWNLPLEICVFLAMVFVAGVIINGAYSKIPQAENIKTATVSLPSSIQEFRYTLDSVSATGCLPVDSITAEQSSDRAVFEFNSPEEIEKILELNNLVRKPAKGERGIYAVRFEYTLKNGKKVERFYRDAGQNIIEKMTSLMRTSAYREGTAELLRNRLAGMTADNPLLISPNLSSMTIPMDLYNDKELTLELFKCVEKDILDGGIPLDFGGEGEFLGYIALCDFAPDDNYIDPEFTVSYGEEDETADDEDVKIAKDCDYLKYYDNNILFSNLCALPVTASAKNTVAFLESNGLMKYLENKEGFVKITCCRYNDADKTPPGDTSTGLISAQFVDKNYQFSVYWADGTEEAVGTEMPSYSTVVTDKSQIAELQKKIRAVAYVGSGYYVKAEFADGDYILAYMPE